MGQAGFTKITAVALCLMVWGVFLPACQSRDLLAEPAAQAFAPVPLDEENEFPEEGEESEEDGAFLGDEEEEGGMEPVIAAADAVTFAQITGHVNLNVPSTLAFSRPDKGSISVGSADYYLSGSSDPGQPLYLNGALVGNRGSQGSFGAFVRLSGGDNTFTISQGDARRTVTVSYYPGAGVQTDRVSNMTPAFAMGAPCGEATVLTCTAPSGGQVSATVNGQTVALAQTAAAPDGASATFRGEIVLGEVSGGRDLGPVAYTLSFGGRQTTYQSAGRLMGVGSGSSLVVQVNNTAAALYRENIDNEDFIASARKGATDIVTGYGEDMYHLSVGGWVMKEVVKPLLNTDRCHNQISNVAFQPEEKGETYVFTGTANPMHLSSRSANRLSITLWNTSGLDELDVSESELFSDATVTESDGHTRIDFAVREPGSLWGYLVEHQDGKTYLFCQKKPALRGGARPLEGLTIALDPGHGATDGGAMGMAGPGGPNEKDINMAAAIGAQKWLEALGADVRLTHTDNGRVDLNQRLQNAADARVDLLISLHGNSIGLGNDGTRPTGIEVYYFDTGSRELAENLYANMAAHTGRQKRFVMLSNYRITLNGNSPSCMVEMGFVSNPRDYDAMCTRQNIYDTAHAVAQGVLDTLYG